MALALAVAVTALSVIAGAIVLTILGFGGAYILRMRYLKEHPPDTELVNKPFWKF